MRGFLRRGVRLLSRSSCSAPRPTHIYAMRLDQGAGVANSLIRLSPKEGEFAQSTIHPAGRYVAYWGQHPDLAGRHIWVADITENCCRPLTRGPQVHGHPAWWPDHRKLVYFATQDSVDWRPEGQFDIQRAPANLYIHCLESGNLRQLTDGAWVDERPSVTPDQKAVIFVSNRSETGLNLWALDVEHGGLRQLTKQSTLDYRPVVAPDNKKIAYFTADEQGRHRLALISWPEAEPLALSLQQDFSWVHGPWWAADSRHILAHGLIKGDARPALWLLDSLEGRCTRMTLPGIRDSSHGSWDSTQSWLAFDSRQDLQVPPATITDNTMSTSGTVDGLAKPLFPGGA